MKKAFLFIALAIGLCFGPKTCPADVTSTASASTITASVSSNIVTADGITVHLSDIRDGANFSDYAAVKVQKARQVEAEDDLTTNWTFKAAKKASKYAFDTVWAAAKWNKLAFHIIVTDPTLIGTAGDHDRAKTALDVAQAILDTAPDGQDKDQVQAWITSNMKYVNTTHYKTGKSAATTGAVGDSAADDAADQQDGTTPTAQ